MTRSVSPLVIETINSAIELLAFQNRQLNGSHSISDIKLLWLVGKLNKVVLFLNFIYIIIYLKIAQEEIF